MAKEGGDSPLLVSGLPGRFCIVPHAEKRVLGSRRYAVPLTFNCGLWPWFREEASRGFDSCMLTLIVCVPFKAGGWFRGVRITPRPKLHAVYGGGGDVLGACFFSPGRWCHDHTVKTVCKLAFNPREMVYSASLKRARE